MLRNRDLNINPNDSDYEFCHNQVAVVKNYNQWRTKAFSWKHLKLKRRSGKIPLQFFNIPLFKNCGSLWERTSERAPISTAEQGGRGSEGRAGLLKVGSLIPFDSLLGRVCMFFPCLCGFFLASLPANKHERTGQILLAVSLTTALLQSWNSPLLLMDGWMQRTDFTAAIKTSSKTPAVCTATCPWTDSETQTASDGCFIHLWVNG